MSARNTSNNLHSVVESLTDPLPSGGTMPIFPEDLGSVLERVALVRDFVQNVYYDLSLKLTNPISLVDIYDRRQTQLSKFYLMCQSLIFAIEEHQMRSDYISSSHKLQSLNEDLELIALELNQIVS